MPIEFSAAEVIGAVKQTPQPLGSRASESSPYLIRAEPVGGACQAAVRIHPRLTSVVTRSKSMLAGT